MSVLYLFGKGMHEGFRGNILNTMAIPEGLQIKYSYNKERNTYYKKSAYKTGMKCIFCYVDSISNSEKYLFYPLREGILDECIEENGRLSFTVRLGAFVSVNHNAVSDFTTHIENELFPEIGKRPHLTNNNPGDSDDGSYASISNIESNHASVTKDNNTSWELAIKYLSSTLFMNNEKTIYYRISGIESIENGKYSAITPSKNNVFEISLYSKIRILITYYNPHVQTQLVKYLSINETDHIKLLGKDRLPINTFQRTESFRMLINQEGETVLVIEPEDGEVSGAMCDLPLMVSIENLYKQSLFPVLLFVFAAAGVMYAVENDSDIWKYVYFIIFSFLQMLSVVWLSFIWKGKIPFFK